jgi:tRNA threonylcarbamoyladenosine biosynthesis protein TsaB
MKILAIDTATEACSAALLWNDAVLTREQVAPQGHTRIILPMVSELLAEAGASFKELDTIAFGRGPGSFTGVRIGIGAAQGLAYGADVPLIGVSTLQMLAQGAYRRQQVEHVVAAIDARMNEIYLGAFSLQEGRMQSVLDEVVIQPELVASMLHQIKPKIAGAIAVGTGFTSYTELAANLDLLPTENQIELNLPWAQDMLAQASAAYNAGEYCDPALATPVYLRDKVTWKKLPGRE